MPYLQCSRTINYSLRLFYITVDTVNNYHQICVSHNDFGPLKQRSSLPLIGIGGGFVLFIAICKRGAKVLVWYENENLYENLSRALLCFVGLLPMSERYVVLKEKRTVERLAKIRGGHCATVRIVFLECRSARMFRGFVRDRPFLSAFPVC